MNKLAYEKREEMIKFIGNILLEDGIKDEWETRRIRTTRAES